MRFLKKIFIISLILIIIFIVVFYLIVNIKGKDLLTAKLNRVFNRDVKVSRVSQYLPLNFYIRNIEIEGLFSVDEVYIGVVFDVFKKTFKISSIKLIKPTLMIDKNLLQSSFLQRKPLILAQPQPVEEKETQPTYNYTETVQLYTKQVKSEPLDFIIKRIVIIDGVLYFTDEINSQETVKVKLENINATIDNLNLGTKFPKKFSFKLTGDILWKEKEQGFLSTEGWIDYISKDMDVNLALQNIDYYRFRAYYPPFWKPENLGVKEAYLSLLANLNSKKNDLLIDAYLSLEKVEFMENFQDTSKINYLKTILELLKVDKEKPTINFKIKTRMDLPKFDFSDIGNGLKGVIKFSPSFVVGKTINKTKDKISESLKDVRKITVDSTFGAIKEFINTIKNIIKIPQEKKSDEKIDTKVEIQIQPVYNETDYKNSKNAFNEDNESIDRNILQNNITSQD